MNRETRRYAVAKCIEAFTPYDVHPGWYEIKDAVDNMTPRMQLEALLQAIKMHCDRLASGGFLRDVDLQ